MKVRCEYCQNMVEAAGDKICPYCGSPLPAAPAGPSAAAPKAAAKAAPKPVLPALILLAALAAGVTVFLVRMSGGTGGFSKVPVPDISISDALAAVNGGTADAGVYQVVIHYYLEGGKFDTAYQAARELLDVENSAEQVRWCVEQLKLFDQPSLAARLAMAWDAKSGTQELYGLVSGISLDKLLPQSPLCQAMELALGRTARNITLADLQEVTGLYIGRRDTLTGAQEIGVAFDEEGQNLTYVTVEFTGQAEGLGTVCFSNLRRFTLNDTNIRTKEDLALPELRELAILLRMDAEDLTKFTHLKKLERLQIGGPSLTSLEGLEDFPALQELYLFDTGLTDLSALASRRQIVRLSLVGSDKLTSVASLSQATHLESLTLSGSALTDLSPLESLRGLEELSVTNTSIRSTAFLSGMTGLRTLTLTGNKELETVPELGELSRLERLTLDSDEMFQSKEDVEKLTHLKALKLRVTKKLSFLEPLQNLEELTIYSFQATWDISGVAEFPSLKRLSLNAGSDFDHSYTASLEGLEALRMLPLEELDLSGKPIYGPLDPVLEIATLRVLNLNGAFSQGTDYGKLANLTSLQRLDLGGYRDMVDTPPGPDEQYWSYKAGPAAAFVDRLGVLTNLTWLSLAGCGAENVGALAALTQLQYLDLSDNDLSDLAALAGLDKLSYLNLTGNRIADYTPVEGRTGLTLMR